eukprot:3741192-Amphidinium_carterae.1
MDIFDRRFSKIDKKSQSQILEKSQELHVTLAIDVFYRLAAIFEKKPADFPLPQEACDIDMDQVVQVSGSGGPSE